MSRAATSRLKVNPILGMRPSLEFRRVAELQIDPTYQRTIDTASSQTLIRRIAQFWDWSLCQPLTVAKRSDGSLMVVDGQHRLAAARLRGDIDDLPCVVTSYANAGDEAAAFVALNQQRRPLSKLDLFKASLAAQDEEATKINELLAAADLSLAGHTNFTAWKAGMVSNIGGIQSSYRVFGAKVTGAALRALSEAFRGEVLQYAGTIFPGIVGLIGDAIRAQRIIDQVKLVSVLRQRSQKDWATEIQVEAVGAEVSRPIAARNVVRRKYEGSKVAHLPTSAPDRVVDDHSRLWCDQCDRSVSSSFASACQSRFCSLRKSA